MVRGTQSTCSGWSESSKEQTMTTKVMAAIAARVVGTVFVAMVVRHSCAANTALMTAGFVLGGYQLAGYLPQ